MFFVQEMEVEEFTSGKKKNRGVRKHRGGSRLQKDRNKTQKASAVKKAGCLCQVPQSHQAKEFVPDPKCQCVLAKAYHAHIQGANHDGNLAAVVRRVMCGKQVVLK